MNANVLRMGFLLFWLAIAGVIVVRGMIAPDDWADRVGRNNLNLGLMLALALVGWNLVRWYMSRRRTVLQKPIPPQQIPDRKDEYIPELDFNKPPTDAA